MLGVRKVLITVVFALVQSEVVWAVVNIRGEQGGGTMLVWLLIPIGFIVWLVVKWMNHVPQTTLGNIFSWIVGGILAGGFALTLIMSLVKDLNF